MGLSMFLSIILALITTPALAQDTSSDDVIIEPVELPGKFTILSDSQPAPFEGTLFDINATASLLTLPGYYNRQCQINSEFLLAEQKAEYDLELENLNIRLDVLEQEYSNTLQQKDLEITTLQDALKKNSKRNPWIWATLGAVVGASATVAIVEVTGD